LVINSYFKPNARYNHPKFTVVSSDLNPHDSFIEDAFHNPVIITRNAV